MTTRNYYGFDIPENIVRIADEVQTMLAPRFEKIRQMREANQIKMIAAFQNARIGESHFYGTTGYGYNDRARDGLDALFADVFGTEDALVRPSFTSGTHAIATALYSVLRPKDVILSVTNRPYETLACMLGLTDDEGAGSLKDYGIGYREVDCKKSGELDLSCIKEQLNSDVKMVYIQRSAGYGGKPGLLMHEIEAICRFVRQIQPQTVIFVDNCYGEFTDVKEPTHIGADMIAGSLIKNPGGGLAPAGGYICSSAKWIKRCANRWNVPGIGKETGCSLTEPRIYYQGFYMAPHTVAESLKGMVFAAALLERFGIAGFPGYDEPRGDMVQAFRFNTKERLIGFCQGIQRGSPVDCFVTPEPGDMPGYQSKVIMAAGSFVQGSSIELSMDAPIHEPYFGYLQGGLVFENVKLALMIALASIDAKPL